MGVNPSARNASLCKNLLLTLCLSVACDLVAGMPGAYAQDRYALQFGGGVLTINDTQDALRLSTYTYELWMKDLQGPTGSWRNVFCKGLGNTTTGRGPLLALRPSEPGLHFDHTTGTAQSPLNIMTGIVANEWIHVALVLTAPNGQQIIYLNGVQAGERSASVTAATQEPVLRIGVGARVVLDDFRVWNYARTPAEIQRDMNRELKGSEKGLVGYWKFNEGQGTTASDSSPSRSHGTIANPVWTTDIAPVAPGLPPVSAHSQSPTTGAVDVPCDVVLGWKAGQFANSHDVYLGTVFDDVNEASRAAPRGVLAGRGQTGTTYASPTPLEFGQTYYWRVDQVNAPPDSTIFKGGVWSFTVEPYSYPVRPVKATAASAQANMGPEKTIDGSGMTGDVHGTEPTTMWLSAGVQPNWIQYEFDQVYQLHEMRVWNSNQMIESFLGFGARKVTIETSTDGTMWTPVAAVPEFARAPGTAGYAANTTVRLGPVDARFVKLTINTNWGGVAPQAGLAEVRFSYIPVLARAPQPATAAKNVGVDLSLDWRPGRRAASHKVFFSTDQAAVAAGTAPAQTVAKHPFDPGPLNFGTTYYWKVDEVNAVTYPGSVWSFTTQEYAVVEDFESYTDKQGEEVFTFWADGMVNGNGSIVGLYPDAVKGTFCETTIVHGGKQSMPFEYNNVKTPYYSEAERTFDKPQDWTGNGADTLVLYFRGNPAAFTEAAGTITMSGGGTDIWNTADQFRFAFKAFTGDATIVAKVESIGNSDPWAKAGVMIRESLDAGSRYAIILASPANGVRFQGRLTTAAAAVSDSTAPAVPTPEQTALKAPVWVKLERKGGTFNGFYSTDGVKWTTMNWSPQTINMAGTIYIGLAVTSHNANASTTAVFSNVATTGNVTGSWQTQAIGVAQPSNAAAPLYVVVQDHAGKSKVLTHPDPAATTLAAWQAWRIPLSDLSAGGVKLTAVKKMTLGVGDRASPQPDGAGKLYFDDIGFGHPVATSP